MVDADRLKASWGLVAAHGEQVPLFFYSRLFLAHPQVRELFPIAMAAQRDKLVQALGSVVSNVDNLDAVVPYLRQLGRDHRKFGALRDHYPAVGDALLATLAHFSGPSWSPEVAADWEQAYGLVAQVMADAADEAANVLPAWWDGTVVSHRRIGLETAIMTVAPHTRLDFVPGQSITVSSPWRPRVWRYYSPANAPRADDTIDLHVRIVDGGTVSTALVDLTQVGDVLRLGPPMGDGLILRESHRPIVMLAGGTGLAPLKALIEQLADKPRRTQLFWGATDVNGLYDLEEMRRLADTHDWLGVLPCVDNGPAGPGVHIGNPVDVALNFGHTLGFDIYACGPTGMISATRSTLVDAGVDPQSIYFDHWDEEKP
ncbi:NAD(P)H-flavin reductase [Stackebrandtia endophytica]|uniref:nitric oxide dioxygenase n=1 Tax=Stackebrandtia endophytica TaxID=1496996 RepID=A0A543AYX7_9ACTN|nr:globin domain-containing protein [Stackebrandtia endophytica]TQL77776.1 NAD(P)H-flavin reductase [Stackebrandtia endophytica]